MPELARRGRKPRRPPEPPPPAEGSKPLTIAKSRPAGSAGRALVGHPANPDGRHLVIPLTVAVWPEGDEWVSQCIELDIASAGRTADEAADECMDAVCSYLNTLEELGERERVFADRAIPVYEVTPARVRLADIPREMAERPHFQVRPIEIPMEHGHPAYN